MANGRLWLLISIVLLSFPAAYGQNTQAESIIPLETRDAYRDTLSEKFGLFEMFRMEVRKESSTFQREHVSFDLPAEIATDWDMDLYRDDLLAERYTSRLIMEAGSIREDREVPLVFRGWLDDQPEFRVGLTINDDFLYGGVYDGEELYMIEPVRYFLPDAPRDLFIIYAASSVKEEVGGSCGYEEYKDQLDMGYEPGKRNGGKRVGMCYEVELAIASDYSMYEKYSSSEAEVEDHNIGVINNVQTNYTGAFDDDIEFIIVEQFISTCSSCDPWTSSTEAPVLLSDFRSWGNNGGFSVEFDLGEMWTDRDFNGPTVGIAYLNSVCGFSGYHVLQDFTGNAELLRVLTAHEIGHNFSADHDAAGEPYIMAPSVTNVNEWSTQSKNEISAFIADISDEPDCLVECNTPEPPVADFSGEPTTICTGESVQFTDESEGTVTSWDWTFDGGTPSGSTGQNPSVTYSAPGMYTVTLEVSNSGGSDEETKANYIRVFDPPVADFDYQVFGSTVDFTNTSQNGDAYQWNFGDGETSTEQHPTHFYAEPGTYTVTLTVENGCAEHTISQTVEIILQPEADFSADPVEGCEDLVVQFTDETDYFPTFWNWAFEGGDPGSSSEQDPEVTYPEPGIYDVTLVVTNAAGADQIVKTDYITVNGLPEADFEWSADGRTVTFTNTSDYGADYSWNFGDGDTSMQEHPMHTYDEDGIFDVQLTVTNDCGTQDTTKTVVVSTLPVAGFSADPPEGCPPLTVDFENQSSSNSTSWNWFFPGGDPVSSTEEHPTVTYGEAGTYDVTLIAVNDEGSDTLIKEQYIEVSEVAMASFEYTVDQYTVHFNNTSSGAGSYHWFFGDGESSTDTDPVHTYEGDGTYDVMFIATGPCGPDTSVQTVELLYPPQAGFGADATEGCEPLTVHFTSEASANTESWDWSFPGGSPSGSAEENPVVTYEQAGTYNVSLVVSNGQGTDQLVRQEYITVHPLPGAAFSYSRDELLVSFTDESEDAVSWYWDFGDGENSTDQHPDHSYETHGTYTVVLVAENDCGRDTSAMEIVVDELPTAHFTSGPAEGCVPLTVQFEDQSSSNVTSRQWSFPGGTPSSSTEAHPEVVYEEAGVYDVSLIVFNEEGSDTLIREEYISVSDVPVADFEYNIASDTVRFEDLSQRAMSRMWEFGDGSSDTAQQPVHIYAEEGFYTVRLIVENACGRDTSVREIQIDLTSISDLSVAEHPWKLYPNPVRGMLYISCAECPPATVDWKVVTANGQLSQSGHWDDMRWKSGAATIDVSDLASGLYYLELTDGRSYSYFKFIVQE